MNTVPLPPTLAQVVLWQDSWCRQITADVTGGSLPETAITARRPTALQATTLRRVSVLPGSPGERQVGFARRLRDVLRRVAGHQPEQQRGRCFGAGNSASCDQRSYLGESYRSLATAKPHRTGACGHCWVYTPRYLSPGAAGTGAGAMSSNISQATLPPKYHHSGNV